MTQVDSTTTTIGRGGSSAGVERSAGTPPPPPPARLTDGLVDKAQAEVLARCAEACAALGASRAAVVRVAQDLDWARPTTALRPTPPRLGVRSLGCPRHHALRG